MDSSRANGMQRENGPTNLPNRQRTLSQTAHPTVPCVGAGLAPAREGASPSPTQTKQFPSRSERAGVADAADVAGVVVVGAVDAGRQVLDVDRVLDVREGAVEDPELAVERPAVQELDHQLDVGGIEEPEGAGLVGAGDGGPLAVPRVVLIVPVDAHLEAPAQEAERP